MDYGLYERILGNLSDDLFLDNNFIETRKIDNSELDKVLSVEYEKLIRDLLINLKDKIKSYKR